MINRKADWRGGLNRREFLIASGAAGLSLAISMRSEAAAVDRVVVVGAGIVGAAVAFNLSKRGCDVTIVDKFGVAAQASGNSFAWINASWFDTPDSYLALRTQSLNEYHRLSDELDFPIHWGGSLEWYHGADAVDEMSDGIRHIQAMGAPAWMIDAQQASEIEPNLDLRGDLPLAWCSRDGAVDPAATTQALVNGTLANGGRLIAPAEVTDIDPGTHIVNVRTSRGTIEGDLVVIAAGADANGLARMINLGTELVVPATPGIIVTTKPVDSIVNTVCYTSDSHFHQLPDGRLIVGEKAGPPQTNQHRAFVANRPNTYPTEDVAMQHAERVLETAARYVPQIADADPESVGVGWRPLPLDGLPTIGHVPNSPRVYLASMHSGVTLAPIVGHLAALEILDGVRVSTLDHFRVERFL